MTGRGGLDPALLVLPLQRISDGGNVATAGESLQCFCHSRVPEFFVIRLGCVDDDVAVE